MRETVERTIEDHVIRKSLRAEEPGEQTVTTPATGRILGSIPTLKLLAGEAMNVMRKALAVDQANIHTIRIIGRVLVAKQPIIRR